MQPNIFFERIGEFCVTFEQICSNLEELGLDLLKDAGIRDEETARIVIANLTAEPLNRLVRSLYAERVKNQSNARHIDRTSTLVFNTFAELICLRNVIIHTKWVEPPANPEFRRLDGKIIGRKIKSDRLGDATLYPFYTEGELQECVMACRQVDDLVSLISHYFRTKKIDDANEREIPVRCSDIKGTVKRLLAKSGAA